MPLIFAQFTDEVAGLLAVGGALAALIRWFVAREKKMEAALRKEERARLLAEGVCRGQFNAVAADTQRTAFGIKAMNECLHSVEHKVDDLRRLMTTADRPRNPPRPERRTDEQ